MRGQARNQWTPKVGHLLLGVLTAAALSSCGDAVVAADPGTSGPRSSAFDQCDLDRDFLFASVTRDAIPSLDEPVWVRAKSNGARVPQSGYSGHRRRGSRGGLRGSPQRALASRSREPGPSRGKACHYLLPASGLLLGVRPNVGGWRSPTGRFGYPFHDQSDHVRPPGTFGGRSGECRRVALAADDGRGPVRSAQRIEARPVPLRRDGVGVMARAPPGDPGPCRRR